MNKHARELIDNARKGINQETGMDALKGSYNPHDGLMHLKDGRVIDPMDEHEVDSYSAKMVAPHLLKGELPKADLH